MSDHVEVLHGVIRRLRITGWIASAVGASVVFVTIGFTIPIFFDGSRQDELGRENLPVVIAILVVGGLLLQPLFTRMHTPIFAWIEEGRQPTEREHERTLRWPETASLITLGGWTVGALIIGAFNLQYSFDFALVVLMLIALAGEATSALLYLLAERVMRPVTAIALAAREPSRSLALGVRKRLLFTWSLGTGVPIFILLIVGIVGATRDQVSTGELATASIFLAVVAISVGLFATVIAARAISDPMTSMKSAFDRIAQGDLEANVPITDASEIGLMQAGFNRMAEGLREREQIRELFGRHVGHDVAKAALDGGVRFSGEERVVGALFVDLVGSTSMALAMPPTEVVRLLNRFFRVVVEVIQAEGGLVNKFEGDAALCVFGAPVASPDPAGGALRAARVLAAELEREVPEVGFGIGVSAGRAVAGNVGAEQRFEYTVIGDPVNEAARLCDLAKERDGHVLASDAAFERASEDEREAWSVGERTVLRGRLDATGLAVPRPV